tara:strand:+ start:210 stop:395 length:186 start_codon:yes stop_codon:yes gene_type:complete
MFVEPKYKTHTTMITLITLLISLLGYGSPADFSDMNESQLKHEIAMLEADGGVGSTWEVPD